MSLLTSLVSYWKMDEASGNALDAHGSNTLTENGTGGIGSATGKIGNARDFEVGDSDSFSIADNASLSTGDIDFTIAAWVKLESIAAVGLTIASKYGAGGTREWRLQYVPASNVFIFTVTDTGINNVNVLASNFGAASTGVWYYVVGWHDSVNDLIGISVNDGTPNTTAHSTGLTDLTAGFRIGALDTNAQFWDGLIDEVGFWKRVLTSQDITDLYNGGAGLAYPFSSAAAAGSIPIFGVINNPVAFGF